LEEGRGKRTTESEGGGGKAELQFKEMWERGPGEAGSQTAWKS